MGCGKIRASVQPEGAGEERDWKGSLSKAAAWFSHCPLLNSFPVAREAQAACVLDRSGVGNTQRGPLGRTLSQNQFSGSLQEFGVSSAGCLPGYRLAHTLRLTGELQMATWAPPSEQRGGASKSWALSCEGRRRQKGQDASAPAQHRECSERLLTLPWKQSAKSRLPACWPFFLLLCRGVFGRNAEGTKPLQASQGKKIQGSEAVQILRLLWSD